jgi:uncharacterized membrane-anchored protein
MRRCGFSIASGRRALVETEAADRKKGCAPDCPRAGQARCRSLHARDDALAALKIAPGFAPAAVDRHQGIAAERQSAKGSANSGNRLEGQSAS